MSGGILKGIISPVTSKGVRLDFRSTCSTYSRFSPRKEATRLRADCRGFRSPKLVAN